MLKNLHWFYGNKADSIDDADDSKDHYIFICKCAYL